MNLCILENKIYIIIDYKYDKGVFMNYSNIVRISAISLLFAALPAYSMEKKQNSQKSLTTSDHRYHAKSRSNESFDRKYHGMSGSYASLDDVITKFKTTSSSKFQTTPSSKRSSQPVPKKHIEQSKIRKSKQTKKSNNPFACFGRK
jgi:hypothetical protein